jgi:hypothetical protein
VRDEQILYLGHMTSGLAILGGVVDSTYGTDTSSRYGFDLSLEYAGPVSSGLAGSGSRDPRLLNAIHTVKCRYYMARFRNTVVCEPYNRRCTRKEQAGKSLQRQGSGLRKKGSLSSEMCFNIVNMLRLGGLVDLI